MSAIATNHDVDALAYEVRIEAPPETVWAYWTEPGRLTRWMGRTATLDPRPGGVFRLDYGNGDVASGAYLEVEPPSRVVFTWGWEAASDEVRPGSSRVEVDLAPEDGGTATRLRLRHTGLPGDGRDGHDEGWQHFLARLVEAVATAGAAS
jgi:uncharacterized protein YndB with AHSA1/START domain